MQNLNEQHSSNAWYRRGKKYRTGTLAALKELYTIPIASQTTKPGSEPKGVKPSPLADAPKEPS